MYCHTWGSTIKVVMLLRHKKHTSDQKAEQARFQRRMKILAGWTALITAITVLIRVLAELIPILVKLLH